MTTHSLLAQLATLVASSSSSKFSTFVTDFCKQIETDNVDLRTLGHQKRLHTFAHIAGFDNWHQLKAVHIENEFKTHLRLDYYLSIDASDEAWKEVKQWLLKERTPNGYLAADKYCQSKGIVKPDPQAISRSQRSPMYFKDSKGVVYTVWQNGNSNYHLPVSEIVDGGKILEQSAKWVVFKTPTTQQQERFVLFDSADSALRCPTIPPISYGVGEPSHVEKGSVIESGVRRGNSDNRSADSNLLDGNDGKVGNAREKMTRQIYTTSMDIACICFREKLAHLSSRKATTLMDCMLNDIIEKLRGHSSNSKLLDELERLQSCSPETKIKYLLADDLLPELLTTFGLTREAFDQGHAEYKKLCTMQKMLYNRGHLCTIENNSEIVFHKSSNRIANEEIETVLMSEEDETTDLGNLLNQNGFDIMTRGETVFCIPSLD